MGCGFWLRINGVWVEIPDVEKGVGYQSERPRSGFVSVGGVPHSQAAIRAPRTWNVPLGESIGPESVAALMVAAQGDGGDVMLWDEAAARANMLDPVEVAPVPGYPTVMCGAMPLRSLTLGAAAVTQQREVQLKANLTVYSGGVSSSALEVGDGQDLLLKVSVPPIPDRAVIVAVQLILTGTGESPMSVHHASNAWTEPVTPHGTADYHSSVPAGALIDSASPNAGVWTFDLGTLNEYANTDLSLRVVGDPNAVNKVNARTALTGTPVLRITYGLEGAPRVFSQLLKGGDYTLGYWTNAAPGTQVGTIGILWAGEWAEAPLLVPASTRSGMRYESQAIPVPDPGTRDPVIVTIFDSTDYLLAGPMLSTLDHGGVYLPPQTTPLPVVVEDPTFALTSLYPGEQGQGQRAVVIREDR